MSADPPRTPPRPPRQAPAGYPVPPAAPLIRRENPPAARLQNRRPIPQIVLENSNSNNNAPGNILPNIPPVMPNHRPAPIVIPPININALLANNPAVMNFRPRARPQPRGNYNNPINVGNRNIPPGSTNVILYNIDDGTPMVNFHGMYNRGQYLTREAFSALPMMPEPLAPNAPPNAPRWHYRRDPLSRARILPSEVVAYTARVGPRPPQTPSPNNSPRVGVKRTRNGNPKEGGKRKNRRSSRRSRRN